MSGCPRTLDVSSRANFLDLCIADDVDLLSQHWTALVARQSSTISIRLCANNVIRWVQVSSVPVMDKSAAIGSITGCVTDISGEKRVEQEAIQKAEALEQLRLSEASLLKFIKHAPLGIMILDKDIRPFFVNDTWLQLTQHEHVPLEEVDVRSVIFEDDVALFDSSLGDLIRTGSPVNIQLRLKRPWSGVTAEYQEQTWVDLAAFLDIVDESSCQVMAAMTDISDYKFADFLQRSRLEEAIEAKRQQEKYD